MCRRRKNYNKNNLAKGRRVIPNLHSKELFQKVNFFKYSDEDINSKKWNEKPPKGSTDSKVWSSADL